MKLTDEELYQLEKHGEDIGVSGAAAEIRRLREQVKTLTDVVERQVAWIKELRRQYGRAAHDFEPQID